MAGQFPFAKEGISSLSIVKKDGNSFNIIPWNYSGSNILISFSLQESMFNTLMTGILAIRDSGDWLRNNSVVSGDEIHVNLVAKQISGILNRNQQSSTIRNYSLVFEVTNVKNTVTLSSDEFQSPTETIKALTLS